MNPLYTLVFYVPIEHAEPVKQALFAAGAGRIGLYDCCSWQTLGTGQFRPLPGSAAFIGEVGALEQVPELRVELVCEQALLKGAIAALLDAHPYEEPAWHVLAHVDVASLA